MMRNKETGEEEETKIKRIGKRERRGGLTGEKREDEKEERREKERRKGGSEG